MRLNVYGKRIDVEQVSGEWVAFHAGSNGKRRQARDLLIPPGLSEEEVIDCLADRAHEWARPGNTTVQRLD